MIRARIYGTKGRPLFRIISVTRGAFGIQRNLNYNNKPSQARAWKAPEWSLTHVSGSLRDALIWCGGASPL